MNNNLQLARPKIRAMINLLLKQLHEQTQGMSEGVASSPQLPRAMNMLWTKSINAKLNHVECAGQTPQIYCRPVNHCYTLGQYSVNL